MIVRYIKFLLVYLFISISVNAHAIQLGKVIFKSNQNSPLDVSIEVNLSGEDKIDLLKPSIAPKENYESQGIERTKIHNDILLSLISKNPNQAILKLTSKIPAAEPFLVNVTVAGEASISKAIPITSFTPQVALSAAV